MLTAINDYGIKIEYPADIGLTEVFVIVDDESRQWRERGKKLGRVEIKHSACESGQLDVTGFEQSPIRRVRRITGYLSNMENFNAAKQDELSQRMTHV